MVILFHHRRIFRQLLPALISMTSYIEVFHLLLDLPLMALALETESLAPAGKILPSL